MFNVCTFGYSLGRTNYLFNILKFGGISLSGNLSSTGLYSFDKNDAKQGWH